MPRKPKANEGIHVFFPREPGAPGGAFVWPRFDLRYYEDGEHRQANRPALRNALRRRDGGEFVRHLGVICASSGGHLHVICTSSEGHLHVVCRDREANSFEDPKLYTINFLKLKDCSCIKNEFHYFRKLQTHLHIYGHHLRVISTSFARHLGITRM